MGIRLSPFHRLSISLGATALATFMLIQIATWNMPTPLKLIGAAAYIALVPSTVVVITLWEEVRASIARILVRPPKRKPRKPMYLSIISASPTLYVLSRGILRGLVEPYAKSLSKLFTVADIALDPYNTATLAIMCSLTIPAALSAITYALTSSIFASVLLALILAPTILASPAIAAYAHISSRRGSVEIETPFFALYATLVERTGKSLITAFERLLNQGHVFKRLSIEAAIIKKMLSFFHYSPIDALAEYARVVPSKLMSRLVSGYVSIVKIGGNTAAYLEASYKSMLEEISSRWSRYVETASIMGDLIVALFMLFPTILSLGAIAFSQSISLQMLQLFSYIIAPMTGIALYVIMDSMQPKIPSAPLLTTTDKIIALSGLPLAISSAIALTNMNIHIRFEAIACISVIVSLLPEIAIYLIRASEVKAVEKGLPDFLRDIAEFLRIGYNVPRAIAAIARNRKYNRFLDNYIRALSILLQLNIPLQRIQQNFITRSWLFNYVLFVLSDLEHLGALTPTELERLSSFVETIIQCRENSRKNLTLYIVLAVLTPLFILLLAIMSSSLVIMTTKGLPTGPIPTFLSPTMIRAVINQIIQLAIIVAIVMGITAAKVREGTGLNTSYSIIALVAVVAVLIFWAQVQRAVIGTITSMYR